MFSSNWFNKLAKDNFEKYIKPNYNGSNCMYLEIGTFEGASLLYMFKSVLTNSESNATVIDPFTFRKNQRAIFDSNLKNYLDRATIITGQSQDELVKLTPNSFDIIYIDGDHTSAAVLNDAIKSFPLLKSGGHMIFDDYLWIYNGKHTCDNINDPNIHNPFNPYTGINTFLENNKDAIDIIVKNWQVVIRKR
jgi:predicted O-methyltransferase YrrM